MVSLCFVALGLLIPILCANSQCLLCSFHVTEDQWYPSVWPKVGLLFTPIQNGVINYSLTFHHHRWFHPGSRKRTLQLTIIEVL